MVSVRTVVDRVGPTLLQAVHVPPGCPAVSDVVIAEPGSAANLAAGDLVLAVAVADVAGAIELIRDSAEHDAAAVLVKPPLAGKPAIRRAAKRAEIGLIEVHAATSWAQLVWLLRTVLDAIADESDTLENGDDAGTSDLFRLADAVASVVDAPVTIEDTNSRVLAYSARQDVTDPARVATIMGRRIPDDVLARFRSRGVFRELTRGRQTIFVPGQRDGTLPRLIVPIRMGGELLGSMWAVVPGPVPDERAAAFADTAPVVALHLLRRRAHADVQRRASAELLRALLRGEVSPRKAVAELDLTDEPHRVVVVETPGGDTLDGEGLRLALLERISQGIGRRPVAAEEAGLLYAVVPDGEGPGTWPEIRSALAETPAGKDSGELRAAAGGARDLTDLSRSRAEAEETLGLLRAGVLAGRVVCFDDVWTALALHRAATASSGARVTELGPLGTVRAYDAANGTEYVATLYEWLRHPGDPRTAATALRIHPNTLRYRMRKLLELVPLDLDDPDVRLALLAQLTALHWA
ncbi:PucR family transcriptional regulator [Prauserella sp. PE36]|uniref:PucR family transcriptional regulator n=1 Tax=Prauserella sp. PE36 TaxID=1504709 RepID=UPI000D940A8A|nr:helix-turn-helix domain-containing protein [Prauserella sp. PE36]PXY26678.1 DNA-binding protein [Prauserella coralliicola]RBM10487.1 PucR family transcriptional regulator [Prauserella sp. PE36]